MKKKIKNKKKLSRPIAGHHVVWGPRYSDEPGSVVHPTELAGAEFTKKKYFNFFFFEKGVNFCTFNADALTHTEHTLLSFTYSFVLVV